MGKNVLTSMVISQCMSKQKDPLTKLREWMSSTGYTLANLGESSNNGDVATLSKEAFITIVKVHSLLSQEMNKYGHVTYSYNVFFYYYFFALTFLIFLSIHILFMIT